MSLHTFFARRAPLLAIAGATLSAGLMFSPGDADACGGLFCSGLAPIVVEQNAERILFELGENTVTTVVEITYTGDPGPHGYLPHAMEAALLEALGEGSK